MTRSRMMLWIAAAVVVAVVSVSSFGGLPSASDMVSGAAAKEQQAQALNAKAQQARAATSSPDQFAESLAAARAEVPPTPELGLLIAQVQREATAAGVSWTSGSPTRASSGESPSWGMEMVVRGSVDQVSDLMARLRAMPRLVVIESVALQQSGPEVPQATLNLSFFATQGEVQSFPEDERAAIEREWLGQEPDSGAADAAG